MKKVIAIISAMAISLTLANAQVGNDTAGAGLNVNDGTGPYGNSGDLWAGITEAASGNTEILTALNDIETARVALAAAHAASPDMSIEDFQAANKGLIDGLKANVALVQNFWRENRTDRPAPVVDASYQNKYKSNAQKVSKTQNQLRAMQQVDPNNPECDTLRQQLAQELGERKQLMRDQRSSGGRQSGDGTCVGG